MGREEEREGERGIHVGMGRKGERGRGREWVREGGRQGEEGGRENRRAKAKGEWYRDWKGERERM